MAYPNGATQSQQVKFATPILLTAGQVAFPINIPALAFIPDTVIVNNQTAATIQVGPSQGGPFQNIRSYSYQPISWQYAPSLWVQQIGTAVIAASDFLEVDVRSSPFGQAAAASYSPVFSAPAGWGGGAQQLPKVNPGDQFFWWQTGNTFPVYNAFVFGADPTGATLSGAAIQSALNAAEAAQRGNNTGIGHTGATVMLPPGQYLTDRQLIVPDRVQMIGHGRSSVIEANTNAGIGALFPTNTAMVRLGRSTLATAFNCRIENLALDCKAVVGSGGVYSNAVQEQSGCHRVIIANFSGTVTLNPGNGGIGIFFDNGSAHATIEDCESYSSIDPGSAAVGVYLSQTTACVVRRLSTLPSNPGTTLPMQAGVVVDGQAPASAFAFLSEIHAEGCTDGIKVQNGASVVISGVDGINTLTNVVHFVSNATNACVALDVIAGGATNTIKDDVNTVTLSGGANPTQYVPIYTTARSYLTELQIGNQVPPSKGVGAQGTIQGAALQAGSTAPPANGVGVQGRITANAVGANASTLTHDVTVPTPTGVAASGTGVSGVVAIALTEINAAATSVSVTITFSSSVAGDAVQVTGQSGATNALITVVAVNNTRTWTAQARLPLSGAAQTVYYSTTGTGNWQLHIYPTVYTEPT